MGRGTTKMHADEAHIDADLVRRLLCAQFPQWADLPVRWLESGGTVNAIFRVGDELTARLPLTRGGTEGLRREARWLPALAPLLPTPIPTVVATGEPGEGYPWNWSVHRWIDGTVLVEGQVAEPESLARDAVAAARSDHPDRAMLLNNLASTCTCNGCVCASWNILRRWSRSRARL